MLLGGRYELNNRQTLRNAAGVDHLGFTQCCPADAHTTVALSTLRIG
jgi:hypothetical protein